MQPVWNVIQCYKCKKKCSCSDIKSLSNCKIKVVKKLDKIHGCIDIYGIDIIVNEKIICNDCE